MKTTLPTDSQERKSYPLYEGALCYFPAALAGVAKHSKDGNDKHNPGEPLHHARGKSMDHESCIMRHLIDLADLTAHRENCDSRIVPASYYAELTRKMLNEANALAWRALALSQRLHEEYGNAPMAPAAKLPPSSENIIADAVSAAAATMGDELQASMQRTMRKVETPKKKACSFGERSGRGYQPDCPECRKANGESI